MVIQKIEFQSELAEEELLAIAEERKPQFRDIPGLIQKYYVRNTENGNYAGIYHWESIEDIKAFRETELAASIPKAYRIIGPPQVSIYKVYSPLRT